MELLATRHLYFLWRGSACQPGHVLHPGDPYGDVALGSNHETDPHYDAGGTQAGLSQDGLGQGAQGKGRDAQACREEYAHPGGFPDRTSATRLDWVLYRCGADICSAGAGLAHGGTVNRRDYPVISGINLLLAGFVLIVNLITDLSYAWLDPRIQYR